jgi:hypothetical protein
MEDNEFMKSNSDANSFSNFNNNSTSMPDSLNELHNKGFSQPNQDQSAHGAPIGLTMKEYEIMNAKLDAIKSELDSMAQHILKIEREIEDKKKRPMW